MTDEQLVEQFRAGPTAQRLLPLYQRYAERIYAWCLGYLGTPERAEDAGALLFTELLAKLPAHEVSNFGAWLRTVVRNHCLMQLRKEKREPVQLSLQPLMQMEDWLHQGEAEASDADTRPLYRCLKQLSEEQRRCVRLFYLQEGESYRSIADRLDLSVGRVRSHLQNGRRNLKICLEGQVS